MIYSCTMFFNEFHLLDLKIAEELDVVDKIIISESDRTFSGNPRSLKLKNNPKYAHPKIDIIAFVGKFTKSAWDNEKMQRDIPLPPHADSDVFIVSDIDEIHKKEDIPKIVGAALNHGFVRIQQRMYYYKINLTVSLTSYWEKSFAVTGKFLRTCGQTFDELRRSNRGTRFYTEGRHFGYLGDEEAIATKIKNFSHTELNRERFTNTDHIRQRIMTHSDPFDRPKHLTLVNLDETYPKTILANLDQWTSHMA